MKSYSEQDISDALQAVKNGTSVRQASMRFGIPRATLCSRINGGQSHKTSAQNLQRLSPDQEQDLVEWVTVQRELGVPVTHAQVQEFAQRVLALSGDTQPLGKRWMARFLERNPSMRTQRLRPGAAGPGASTPADGAEPRETPEQLRPRAAARPRAARTRMDSADFLNTLNQLRRELQGTASGRLLIRKILKGYKQKEAKLEGLRKESERLEAELAELQQAEDIGSDSAATSEDAPRRTTRSQSRRGARAGSSQGNGEADCIVVG